MATMSRQFIRLDVREDIRAGREPFGKIMDAVSRLRPDDDLQLIAPFEPKPLIGLLNGQGFHHQVKDLSGGDFEVHFSREPLVVDAVDLDARGLEPPEPMVRILEAVEKLPRQATLRARTNLRPLHLLARLKERGMSADCTPKPDGSFLTVIRRG